MNKNKSTVSLGLCLALICLSIIMCMIASKRTSLPDSCNNIPALLDACTSRSESKINKNLENKLFAPNFSKCVTAEDYLSACGISFGFMRDEACKLNDIKLLGAKETEDDDVLMNLVKSADKDAACVYIAADYTDSEGAERTAVSGFYVISDSKSGKITSIMKADR